MFSMRLTKFLILMMLIAHPYKRIASAAETRALSWPRWFWVEQPPFLMPCLFSKFSPQLPLLHLGSWWFCSQNPVFVLRDGFLDEGWTVTFFCKSGLNAISQSSWVERMEGGQVTFTFRLHFKGLVGLTRLSVETLPGSFATKSCDWRSPQLLGTHSPCTTSQLTWQEAAKGL